MGKTYFRAKSLEEEKFLKECEEKGIDILDLLRNDSPKRVYQILKTKDFKFLPSQPTLYRWRKKLLIEDIGKEEVVSKVEEKIDEEIKKEIGEEISALYFLKQVIKEAFLRLENVTVLDGIKAAEMLLKMGEDDTPESILEKINKALEQPDSETETNNQESGG